MEYNKRMFNLGNVAYRISNSRIRYKEPEQQEASQCGTIPKIPKGIPENEAEESPLGSILIRIILCITIFSSIMLMKNSNDDAVSICYDALSAWSTCSYSIPEEYGIEKFVAAIKSGDIVSVFSPASFPAIKFPKNGEVIVHYGEKNVNGETCLGIIMESTVQSNIVSSINGSVIETGENETLGKFVTIENKSGVRLIYGCCDDIIVSIGDAVDTDTIIAKTALGKDNKYYMYLEVQNNDNVVNPEKCFSESI